MASPEGATAAPPMAGLGNYKGVMLCNRPSDDGSGPGGALGGNRPFKSMISATVGDKVGLAPPKRMEANRPEVKTCGPSAALRRHVKWIKELQEQVQEDKQLADQGEMSEEARKHRMKEAFARQRVAIKQMKDGKDMASIEPHEVAAALVPKAKKASGGGGGGSQKPLWAMTEAERDVAEDDDAADLIDFAENLDFDRYIDDLEFRQCLHVVRDRAKRLQREQDSFKDSILNAFNAENSEDEIPDQALASEDGSHRGAGGRRPGHTGFVDERPDWDTSTACGEDHLVLDRGSRSAAEAALEANPKLKSVHSKASAARMLERASAMGSQAPSEAG